MTLEYVVALLRSDTGRNTQPSGCSQQWAGPRDAGAGILQQCQRGQCCEERRGIAVGNEFDCNTFLCVLKNAVCGVALDCGGDHR